MSSSRWAPEELTTAERLGVECRNRVELTMPYEDLTNGIRD
jgi:hypothetical protein